MDRGSRFLGKKSFGGYSNSVILKNDYDEINPFIISDRLLSDKHDLVLKGFGWMLKALSQVDQHCVEEYVIKNHSRMPRVAYRYALEKFDKETRAKLMGM